LDPGAAEPDIFRSFASHERLDLRFRDVITRARGHGRDDVDRLLQFGRAMMHPRAAGRLLIHCHAGLSRSTAASVQLLAQAQLDRPPETAVSQMLGIRPNAWPNLRMIELGDQSIACEGRLVRTVRSHYADIIERFPMFRHGIRSERHLPDRAEHSPRPTELEA
jgi:predicted protein tyrosine phosphatase